MAFHSKSLQHQTYKTCFNLTRSHYLSCFSRKRLFEVQTRKRKHSSTNCRRKTKGRLSFMTFITNFLIWYMLIGFTICEMRSLCDSARGWKTSGHDCLLRGFALPLSYRSRLRMVETSKQKCLKKKPAFRDFERNNEVFFSDFVSKFPCQPGLHTPAQFFFTS